MLPTSRAEVDFAGGIMRPTALVCVSLILTVTAPAVAQETTGEIVGAVISMDGAPLPGVDITLENPRVGFSRSAVSRDNGEFRFPALIPAQYQLTAERRGFKSVKVPVDVDLGRAVTVELSLEVGSFEDAIEVTAAVPNVDVTSTVSGFTTNTDDLLSKIPVQREVTQIALLAPGTYAADNYWQQPAWTGLLTPGQGFVSSSGSSFGENSYQLNGLNITNFRWFMGSSFVPMEFVDEVQVKTGGYEAEFGRSTGAVINMVTKRGTNIFRGGFSAYWEPESLQEQEPDAYGNYNQDEGRENFELNASLGGPILRDRLFFFGFVRYSDTWFTDHYTATADLHETSTPYWGAKIDWSISSDHRLEGTYFSDDVDVDFIRYNYDSETRVLLDARGTGVRRRGGSNFILKYSGLLSSQLLLSAQAGRYEFDLTRVTDGEDCPLAFDYRGGMRVPLGCWVINARGTDGDVREAYRVDLDWFVGRHSLRAGADYELNLASSVREYSGGVSYGYYLNGSEDQDPEEYRYPELSWDQNLVQENIFQRGGEFEVNSSAAYVQDSWSVTPTLTLNLGVRWERYENKNGLGGTFIETDDQWAPRLGVIWDPSGAGLSKLYASFGTYHMPVSAQVNISDASATYRTESWYAFDGDVAADGSPVTLGEQLEHFVFADGDTPDPRENISHNFEPMAQNEVIVGYERRLGGDWTVGLRGVARWYKQIIEDYTLYQGLWNTYGVECLNPDLLGTGAYCWTNGSRLGNPGREFEGWYDVDGDGELDRVVIPADQLGYPEAERSHYALEFTFGHRFAHNWMLNGSYTWSRLYGNYEGTISDEWGDHSAGMTGSYDYPYMMEHSSGDLPGDIRHNLKAYGVYSWDFGLQAGGNLYYHTGRPVSSFGRHPDDPWAAATAYPSYYTAGEPKPRGCCGRTDDVWGLDLLLMYSFRSLGVDWNVRLDAFNVFNNQNVVRVWLVAEDPYNGVPVDGYGDPEYYQPPRTVRLGFGLSF